MVYIGNSLSARQCLTDYGSKSFFFGSCSKGRMHDARMLDTSGLYVDLAQSAFPLLDRRCDPFAVPPLDMGCYQDKWKSLMHL